MLSSRTAQSLRSGARASTVLPRLARPLQAQARSMTYVYNEGSVAQSKEFSKKERAHEDQFVKQHEMEQIKKLRAQYLMYLHGQIEKKKAELADLEREHAETLEKANAAAKE